MKPKSLRLKFILGPQSILWLGALIMLAFANWAQAAPQANVTCTTSAPVAITTYYGSLLNVTSGSITVTCSVPANPGTAIAQSVSYQLSLANSVNNSGTQRRALSGATYLNYSIATDPGCFTSWNTSSLVPATLYTTPLLGAGASDIKTYYYYGCVAAGLLPAAGTYTDGITVNFVNTAFSGGTPTFTPPAALAPGMTIIAYGTCSITAPATIMFSYTAFSAAAVSGTGGGFTITCSSKMPYTLSLDAGGAGYTGSFSSPTGTYTNTATALTYSLTLPTTTPGTGAAQSYTITGSMASGQAGKCTAATCSVTDTHMLTVTY